ncbi:hypothetical protein WJX73_005225 [Symbiochloris irregularis]|uniref:Uncharacterized protein n=1 Tax=Symbiochloris irregularis TaxID=706552 RepID=A0AAW1NW26_9CHLO
MLAGPRGMHKRKALNRRLSSALLSSLSLSRQPPTKRLRPRRHCLSHPPAQWRQEHLLRQQQQHKQEMQALQASHAEAFELVGRKHSQLHDALQTRLTNADSELATHIQASMQAEKDAEQKHLQEAQGLKQRLQAAQSSHEQLQKILEAERRKAGKAARDAGTVAASERAQQARALQACQARLKEEQQKHGSSMQRLRARAHVLETQVKRQQREHAQAASDLEALRQRATASEAALAAASADAAQNCADNDRQVRNLKDRAAEAAAEAQATIADLVLQLQHSEEQLQRAQASVKAAERRANKADAPPLRSQKALLGMEARVEALQQGMSEAHAQQQASEAEAERLHHLIASRDKAIDQLQVELMEACQRREQARDDGRSSAMDAMQPRMQQLQVAAEQLQELCTARDQQCRRLKESKAELARQAAKSQLQLTQCLAAHQVAMRALQRQQIGGSIPGPNSLDLYSKSASIEKQAESGRQELQEAAAQLEQLAEQEGEHASAQIVMLKRQVLALALQQDAAGSSPASV